MSDSSEAPIAEEMSPKPRWWIKIVAPLAVLIALLGLIEIVLQLFMALPVYDRVVWKPDGHVKAILEPNQRPNNEHGNPVRINHLGFRGDDWGWAPEPGTLRIAALGGSSTFCFQVTTDEKTWPARLEAILSERLGQPVEVINLALPGYDTSNSKVHYLFHGRAFNPHVVLVYHTWNDLKFLRPIEKMGETGMPSDALSGRPSTGRNKGFLFNVFRRLQIVRRLDNVLSKMKRREVENTYTSMEKAGERAHQMPTDRAWAWFRQNFVDVARFVQADDVVPVLISQATLAGPENADDAEKRVLMNNNYVGMTIPVLVQAYQKAEALVREAAAETGAIYIDGYAGVPRDLEHLKDHVHLLDPGAERLAQVIADGLMASPAFRAKAAAAAAK